MTLFPVLTAGTAPEEARPIFGQVQAEYGLVPNLLGVMAAAPGLMDGYLHLARAFRKSSFSTTEQQIVLMTVSYENECGYCMAGHSAAARRQSVADAVIIALRAGETLPDAKQEALRQFTRAVVRNHGRVEEDEMQVFMAAGYTPRQGFEVILGVSAKVMSNYANHFADTPLDPHMRDFAWLGKPAPMPQLRSVQKG